jgi:hypothetical protein
MPFLRCATIFLLISATVLLTGARNPQTKLNATPANPETHSAAVRLLDEALARLDSDRVQWLDTKLWQKGRLGRYDFEVEGRYLAAPDHRFRLEITSRHGRAASTTLTVSNGLTITQGNRAGDGPWSDLFRVDVNQVFHCPQPGASPIQSGEIQESQSSGPVVPLLRSLRSGTKWSRIENVRRGGQVFVKLSGAWQENTLTTINSPSRLWSVGMPRRCRLYLDQATLWPQRIEWWGPDVAAGSDTLLLQMEYRDPVINQPMTAEQCAREFNFAAPANQLFDNSHQGIQRIRQFLAQPVSAN